MVKGEDLLDWYRENIPLKKLLDITYSIFSSLAILHSLGIYHRDIKLENIIYDSKSPINSRIKLIDFDFSCSKVCKGIPGTQGYVGRMTMDNVEKERRKFKHSEDWQYADIVAAAIVIFKLYAHRENIEMYFNFDKNTVKKLVRTSIEETLEYRVEITKHKKEELSFAKYIRKLFDADMNKKRTAHSICIELEGEYGHLISEELIDSYRSDVEFYSQHQN
jgi:hypothetical protein